MLHKWDISACPMSSMGFAESAGIIFGAGETSRQVYFGKLVADGQASEPIAARLQSASVPQSSFNGKQRLLVWTEGTGWQRGGSLAHNDQVLIETESQLLLPGSKLGFRPGTSPRLFSAVMVRS